MTGMGLPPPPGSPPAPGPPPGAGQPPPTPGPVAIRPLNLGELLDGAFKLFVANWRTIVVATGIFLVPLQLLSAYLQRDLLGGGLLEMLSDPTAAQMFTEAGGLGEDQAVLLGVAQSLVILPLLTGVVAAIVGASYLGGSLQVGEALAAGLRRWWALIASWLLLILASLLPLGIAVGILPLAAAGGVPVAGMVLLGIVLVLGGLATSLAAASLFAAAPAAIVIEALGPLQGLRRSARLLRPRLPAVLGTLVVAVLLVSVLSMVLGGIPQFVGLMAGDRLGWLLVAVGGIAAGLVTTPLFAIVVTLLYFDGRVRQEALDLRLAADRLSRDPTEGDIPGGLFGR